MEYQAVSESQRKILEELKKTGDTLNRAERRFRVSELMADSEEDKQFLRIKAMPEKQTDSQIKAKAREAAYEKRLTAILKESVYKKVKLEYELLEKEWGKLLIDASMAKELVKRFSGEHENE